VFDSYGNNVSETHYDSGGDPVALNDSGYLDEAFACTGRLFDKDTGLQNNLNRWYDSKIGRWLSEDPIGFAAGDANLYRYAGNAPLDVVDPSGLITIHPPDGNGKADPDKKGEKTGKHQLQSLGRDFAKTVYNGAKTGLEGMKDAVVDAMDNLRRNKPVTPPAILKPDLGPNPEQGPDPLHPRTPAWHFDMHPTFPNPLDDSIKGTGISIGIKG
jgi:RHS repeat-associated protein